MDMTSAFVKWKNAIHKASSLDRRALIHNQLSLINLKLQQPAMRQENKEKTTACGFLSLLLQQAHQVLEDLNRQLQSLKPMGPRFPRARRRAGTLRLTFMPNTLQLHQLNQCFLGINSQPQLLHRAHLGKQDQHTCLNSNNSRRKEDILCPRHQPLSRMHQQESMRMYHQSKVYRHQFQEEEPASSLLRT